MQPQIAPKPQQRGHPLMLPDFRDRETGWNFGAAHRS
jgi:hypothetical protein